MFLVRSGTSFCVFFGVLGNFKKQVKVMKRYLNSHLEPSREGVFFRTVSRTHVFFIFVRNTNVVGFGVIPIANREYQ